MSLLERFGIGDLVVRRTPADGRTGWPRQANCVALVVDLEPGDRVIVAYPLEGGGAAERDVPAVHLVVVGRAQRHQPTEPLP